MRSRPLLTFFVLSFAVMWAFFITVAVAGIPVTSPLGYAMLLAGTYSPAFVAVWVASRTEGGAGVRALIGQIFKTPVAFSWYLFAAAFMTAVHASVAVTHRIAEGTWPGFSNEPWIGIVAAIVFLAPFQAGEELGWRGFALPRLITRFGFVRASILLGLIWSVWHIPQFFIRDGGSYGQPFPHFLLQVTAISVVMAWVYVRTGASLLPVMLLHSGINNTWRFASASPDSSNTFGLRAPLTTWLTAAVLWACAVCLLARSRTPRRA